MLGLIIGPMHSQNKP